MSSDVWREDACTFVPGVKPRTFEIDSSGCQPYGSTATDCALASAQEWLVMAITVVQESENLQPPCWLELVVSHSTEWRRDVAADFLVTDLRGVKHACNPPIHIYATERFRLQQRGDDSNKLSVTLHLLRKQVVA